MVQCLTVPTATTPTLVSSESFMMAAILLVWPYCTKRRQKREGGSCTADGNNCSPNNAAYHFLSHFLDITLDVGKGLVHGVHTVEDAVDAL